MNRFAKAAGLTFVALLALTVPAFAQANVGGTWNLEVQTPDGSAGDIVAILEQDGEEFKGELSSELGVMEFSGGMIEGSTISFVLELDMQGQYITIEVTAEVDGDTMSGEFYVAEFGGMPFSGEREG